MDDVQNQVDWIAVDWGTSNLRAFAMDAGGVILAQGDSDRGMGGLKPAQFEGALLDVIGDWLAPERITDVLACGMVGARQGWVEAAYASVPWTPGAEPTTARPATNDPRLSVRILPGLSQDQPADVMRGEETQIAGVLATYPGFEGVVCLPGTHSKWAEIITGELVSFRTFMTGEMFALLSTQSVLRHSTGDGWDDDAFDAGVTQGLSGAKDLSGALFSIRAETLLQDLSPAAATARLSGMLIGWELAGSRPWWLGREVVLVGEPTLCALYDRALTGQGVVTKVEGSSPMTLAGLRAARATMTK